MCVYAVTPKLRIDVCDTCPFKVSISPAEPCQWLVLVKLLYNDSNRGDFAHFVVSCGVTNINSITTPAKFRMRTE